MGSLTGGPSAINLSDLHDVSITSPATGQYLRYNGAISEWQNAYIDSDVFGYLDSALSGTQGVTITTVSGPNTIAIGLGAITPSSVTSSGTVTGTNLSGTNTGDQTITLTGDVTGSGTATFSTTLATVNSSPQTDTFRRITVNGKGLVTATSSVTSSDITTALTYTPVDKAGDTMSGYLILNADPASSLGAATKQYVDSEVAAVASGVNVHAACETSTTAALPTCTYNNGSSGVGATLTANSNGALGTVGGYGGLTVSARLLVKNQAATLQNGIYVVTQLGDGSNPWILTRATDFDGSPTSEISAGDMTYVQEGTLGGTQWVETAIGTGSPGDYIIVGTDPIVFSQFSGAGVYTAGSGIDITTNVISNTGVLSIVAGSGIGISGGTGNVTITATGGGGTVTSVNITPPSAGIGASGGPITGSGSITLSLTNDLAAVEGLSTNGLTVRSATDTWITRNIAVSGTGLSVTDPDGILGNPTVTSNATSANTASTIVARDGSGNFTAGTITASLTGAASLNVLKAGDTMSGALNEAPVTTIASGSTVNLATATSNTVTVTGTSTINSFGTIASGARRALIFSGVCTVTNSANIINVTGANIVTAANQTLEYVSLGSGVWQQIGSASSGGSVSLDDALIYSLTF